MPEGKRSPKRGLKICCGVTIIFLIILVVFFVALYFTMLKPKQPDVIAHPTTLENIDFQIFPTLSLNITLGLVITTNNRNYGSFRFKNTTAYISYHGTTIAEVPIEHDKVPARGKHNVSTYAIVTADKLISSPFFWGDLGAGKFNLTSLATLHAQVSVVKIFKMGATVHSACEIFVLILSQDVMSHCHSKIKL